MTFKTLIFSLFLLLAHLPAKAGDWIYQIKPGDNLWNLARQFLKDVDDWPKLQFLNGIQEPRRIQPGTEIRVPIHWLKVIPGTAKVISLYGNVTLLDNHQKRGKISTGQILPAGVTLQTGALSNITLRFRDGSIFLLKSGGEVKLRKLRVYPGTGMVDTRLEQKKGKSESKVQPKRGPGSRFEIKTPAAVAGVRGTVLRIEAKAGGGLTETEVPKGEVIIQGAKSTRLVPPGYGTLAKPDESPLPPVALLPPPDLSDVPAAFEQNPLSFRFRHQTGAIRYQLEIAPNRNFNQLLYENSFPSTTIKGPKLKDGHYVLRIRAVDHHGLEGFDAYHEFTVNADPEPPRLLQPLPGSQVAAEQPVLRWQSRQSGFGYQLQIANDFHFHQLTVNEPHLQVSRYIPGSLRPGRYFWRVAALDTEGQRGPFSPGREFVRLPPPPKIDIVERHGVPVALQWPVSGEDTHFHLQIAWDRDFGMVIVDTRMKQSTYALSTLKPGHYFVRIKTNSEGWEGPFSSPLPLQISPQS